MVILIHDCELYIDGFVYLVSYKMDELWESLSTTEGIRRDMVMLVLHNNLALANKCVRNAGSHTKD